jgi:NitT/TauT family transport system ATP-binding protein
VIGSNPGHIAAEIPVSLPQPRNRLDAPFHAIVDQIYSILTSRMTQAIGAQS